MPTERFYRLAAEKQSAIWRAAFDEFASEPFEKASINRIIQTADISRGSFYTYFEDKKDLLHWMFSDVIAQVRTFLEQEVDATGGDVFRMLERFFELAVRACGQDDWFSFSHNVMSSVNPEEAISKIGMTEQGESDNIVQYLYKKVDLGGFRSQSLDDFRIFMETAAAAMMISMRQFYEGMPLERVVSDYRKKLRFLKYGVCK